VHAGMQELIQQYVLLVLCSIQASPTWYFAVVCNINQRLYIMQHPCPESAGLFPSVID
jgi:hypothetical protein